MAPIIAVHGISQQTSGSKVIHSEWWPALCSGLELDGYYDLQDESKLVCPFYGHFFRKHSKSAIIATEQLEDDIELQAYEKELLKLLLSGANASRADKISRSFQEDDLSVESLDGVTESFQDLLRKLSKFGCLVNLAQGIPELIGHDLKQVGLYLNDEMRTDIRETVIKHIQEDTKVVIGHSLGSVVAYEALCEHPGNVVSFISIGSPLGIEKLIFNKLKPSPINGKGKWPGKIKYWTNLAEKDDIVALEKQLNPLFGDEARKLKVIDIEVDNSFDAHDARRYLTTIEAGKAVRQGLESRVESRQA
jgi:hypothetical protein